MSQLFSTLNEIVVFVFMAVEGGPVDDNEWSKHFA
jgi:hypothetical protein